MLGTADRCGWVNFVALICREYFGSCLVAQVVIMRTFLGSHAATCTDRSSRIVPCTCIYGHSEREINICIKSNDIAQYSFSFFKRIIFN